MKNDSECVALWDWFCILLTIALIILKLCGVIVWSWVVVFSPLWAPFVLMLFFVFLAMIFKGVIRHKHD